MQDFSILLKKLAEAGLDFVIVGGFAAITHGSSYLTRDVDICAVLTPENIARLRVALVDWNPKHRMTPQRLSFLAYPSADQPVNNTNVSYSLDFGGADGPSSASGNAEHCPYLRSANIKSNSQGTLVLS